DVAEEQPRVDPLAANGSPCYAAGVEIKPVVKLSDVELLNLKIVKGMLVPTLRYRETKTYFVQNSGDEARALTVDHVVRKEYKRLDKGGDQVGPAVFRFKLEVPVHKTAQQEVVEERTYQESNHPLQYASEETLRNSLASTAASDKVKAALKQFQELRAAAQE